MASVTLLLVQCFYFMLPAYFANMAPVIVKKIPFLKIPIDFGIQVRGQPLFGRNKTYRGLLFGIAFGIAIAFVQFLLSENTIARGLTFVDYSHWLAIGFLMGFGAIVGDIVESFVKRRLRYPSGKPFIPLDQLDFVVGALLFVYPIVVLSVEKIIIILLLSLAGHIVVNHVAFFLKIRNEKW